MKCKHARGEYWACPSCNEVLDGPGSTCGQYHGSEEHPPAELRPAMDECVFCRLKRAEAALLDLAQGIEDLFVVATVDVDAEGFATGYHFKTGALHRLLGRAREYAPGTNRIAERPVRADVIAALEDVARALKTCPTHGAGAPHAVQGCPGCRVAIAEPSLPTELPDLFKAYQAKRNELQEHRRLCRRGCANPDNFPAACDEGNRLYDATKAALTLARAEPPTKETGR